MATCGDKESWAMDPLVAHYNALCKYLNWEDAGKVLAIGVYERNDIESSAYPQQAYELGKTFQ